MPNHITNCWTIEGDETAIEHLRTNAFLTDEDGNEAIDFAYFIKPPEGPYMQGEIGMDAPEPNWYTWNIANWGTKWNPYSAKIVACNPRQINLKFETAWAPPQPIIDRIIGLGLKLSGYWKDEGRDEIHRLPNGAGNWFFRNADYKEDGEIYHEVSFHLATLGVSKPPAVATA